MRNGALPEEEGDANGEEGVKLPPPDPSSAAAIEWPPECFTRSYDIDEAQTQNMASVYKAAWISTHRHYCEHRAAQRGRHMKRHAALTELGATKQAEREAAPPLQLAPGPWQARPHRPGSEQPADSKPDAVALGAQLPARGHAHSGAVQMPTAHNLATHSLQPQRGAIALSPELRANQAAAAAGQSQPDLVAPPPVRCTRLC